MLKFADPSSKKSNPQEFTRSNSQEQRTRRESNASRFSIESQDSDEGENYFNSTDNQTTVLRRPRGVSKPRPVSKRLSGGLFYQEFDSTGPDETTRRAFVGTGRLSSAL